MDYMKLADLIFPDITGTIEELEARFPGRELGEGARVTRFAPSPTGYMHIGGLYAAMISRKFAKQSGGVFYLRIEDTDKKRELEGGVVEIIDSLKNFDLEFDEGPFAGGESIYAPFKQSDRKEIYQICVKALMQKGLAYPCFTTAEELDELRKKQEEAKVDIGYYGEYATDRNLTYEEVKEKLDAGVPFTVRLLSPGTPGNYIAYSDPVRGKIEMPENIMDLVLLKSDGIPTYHFAHAVDDHFMRTNLVVRGDEWLASYPTHKQLFAVCGFKEPKYVHISPIMKMDGNGKRKLSKRKDPEAAVGYYLEQGYPVEGVLEYLMTIANSNFEEWRMKHPDASMDEFTLSPKKMPVSGALFDMMKLTDICKEVISKKSIDTCYEEIVAWAKQYEESLFVFATENEEQFKKTIGLWKMSGGKVRKDVAKWSDIMEMFDYLYAAEESLDFAYEVDEKFTKDMVCEILDAYEKDLFLDSENWFDDMKKLGEPMGYCPNMKEYKKNPEAYKGSIGDLCGIIRMAITGRKNSPDLYTILTVLGEKKVVDRLEKFRASLS